MRLMRRRQKNKQLSFSMLIIIFVVTLLTFSIGYSLMSQDLSIEGRVNINSAETIKSEFRTDNLLLTYTINSWNNAGRKYFQYDFTLENIGVNDFEVWDLIIYLPPDSEQVGGWEARYDLNMGELSAMNMAGRTLPSGTKAIFGYQFSTIDEDFELKKVKMDGIVITLGESGGESGGETGGETGGESGGETGGETGGESGGETGGETGGESGGESGGETGGENSGSTSGTVTTGAIKVTFEKNTSWGSSSEYYHQYSFVINNISNQNITEWAFDVIVPEGTTVHQNWGCNYIDFEDRITISNGEYNGNLSSDGTTNMSIIFISDSSEMNISIE